MAKEHVIIKNISKIYPDGTKALHDINLVILVVWRKRHPERFSSMIKRFPGCP